jgi:hypothetical protein
MTTPLAQGGSNYDSYCYYAIPVTQDQTGVRGFAIDASGRVCQNPTGLNMCATGPQPGTMELGCTVLQ